MQVNINRLIKTLQLLIFYRHTDAALWQLRSADTLYASCQSDADQLPWRYLQCSWASTWAQPGLWYSCFIQFLKTFLFGQWTKA